MAKIGRNSNCERQVGEAAISFLEIEVQGMAISAGGTPSDRKRRQIGNARLALR